MTSFVSHTSVDCLDAYALSEFWKAVLGYADLEGDPNQPGHEECMIRDPETGHQILFIQVPDAKTTKNRLHFDLRPREGSRDEELARLLELGATQVFDMRGEFGPGTGWVVLADPEGNEFCILRSVAEVEAATPPQPMVPESFEVPLPPDTELFAFEVLGPEHNEPDLAAWTSSVPFIQGLPGWQGSSWPSRVYTAEENLADLVRHRDRHGRRLDFAWTVLDAADPDTVVGCVYITRDRSEEHEARVRSWVIAARPELDAALYAHIDAWVRESWPFASYDYAARELGEISANS